MRLRLVILLAVLVNFLSANLVGSIEGKLNVNMGKVHYSLPLSLPKGKNNIAPSVAITYAQGSGDGILGVGFNISGLSMISRCGSTEKIDGYNGGVTYGNNAHYCLDGARLIKLEDGTFRPANRNDIKVEAVGSATNPTSWVVYSSNGAIKEYGKNSAIIKNGKYTKKWYMTATKDRLNNRVDYIYKKINNVLYLTTIKYKPYSIEFSYQKRASRDSMLTYSEGKKIYLDRRVNQITIKLNSKLFAYYKLNYNKKFSQLKSVTWCDRNKKCLKPVEFGYKQVDDTVAHIEERNLLDIDDMLNYFEVDMNNDGLNDILYYEKGEGLKYSLNQGNGNLGAPSLWSESITSSLNFNDDKKRAISQAIVSTLMPIDLNNDGFIDYCVATEKGIYCGLNDGNGGISNEKYWTTQTSIKDAFRYLDINQDRKIDICKFTSSGFSCALNSGHNFGAFKIIDRAVGSKLLLYKEVAKANYSDKNKIPQPQLFDINGDGKSDLCGFSTKDSAFYCKLGISYDKVNKRPKFSSKWIKWGSGFPLDNKKVIWKEFDARKFNISSLDYYSKQKDFKYFEIDIDDNGKYDLCSYDKSKKRLYCAMNTSLNQYAKEDKTEVLKRFNRTFRFIDLNNDKLPDICYRKSKDYVCRINNGKNFNKEQKWLTLDKSTWPFYISKFKKEDVGLFFRIKKSDSEDMYANNGLKTHIVKSKPDYDKSWLVNMQEGSIAMRDIDGDGLADFTAIIAEELYWAKNLGSKFATPRKLDRLEADVDIITKRKTIYANWIKRLFGLSTEIETNFVNTAYGPVKMLSDLDGKNNKELCYRSASGLSCLLITNKPFSLLNSVTNSLGKKSIIEYGKIITDNLQNGATSEYENSHYTNNFVVKSVTSDDGIGGSNTMLYKYGKMVFSEDNKPLGFDSLTQINRALKAKSVTHFYREDSALNGQVKKQESYMDNHLTSTQENSYEEVKQEEPYLNYARAVKKVKIGYDTNGQELFKKVTKSSDFNEYNAPQTLTEITTDITGLEYIVTTETEYLNDTTHWLINKPTEVTVAHTNGSSTFARRTESSYYDNGRLKSTTIEPHSNNELKTEYKYNKDSIVTTVSSKSGSRTSKKYLDSLDRVIKTENALKQITSQITYDSFCIQQPKSVTDISGLRTTYKYDSQCRVVEKAMPNGVRVRTKYELSDGKADRGVDFNEVGFKDIDVTKYMTTTSDNIGGWSRTYYDALERVVRVIKKGDKNKNIIVDTVYDNAGRVIGKTLPYFEGHGKGYNASWIKSYYDNLGRLVKQETPIHDNKTQVTTYSYDGLSTTITSPNKHKKIIYKNALDKTIKITQNDGTSVYYTYDALGNLTKTKVGNRVTTITYDKLGRKVALNTPESGKSTYSYNAFGELVSQTDAKGVVTKFTYDELGRILTKKVAKKTVTYHYTKDGKVSKIVSNNKADSWSKEYRYNNLGELKEKTVNIDDQELTESYIYDSVGRLKEKIYPSGMSLKYYYTANNFLDRITIPKNELWDYEFISLEKKLEEVTKYIAELEIKSNKLEKRLIYYSKKSEQYRRYARDLIKKIKKEDANVRKYYRLSKRMDSYIRSYSSKLYNFRKKVRYLKRRVGNVTFKYVKRVGNYYKYRYTKCVKKNWKGHCKKYRSVSFNIPRWLIKGRSRYCSGGWKHRHCHWGPQKYIRLSSIYSKMSYYYKRKIYYKKRAKRYYDNKKNKAQRAKNYYQRKYKQYIKIAKSYAKAAKRDANMLNKVARELENQKKAQAELEKAIDARNSDDSEQLIWSATSYNARGQIEGELAGNGYLTTRYHEVDGTIKQIKVGVAKKLIANYTYTYDNRNNLLSRRDNIEHISEKFTYDNLDRLSSWRLSSNKLNIQRSYRYDIYGNMVYKSNVGEFGFNAKNQIVSAPSRLGFFNYDKNGNMLNGNNKEYVYNKANQVVRVEYNKNTAYEEYLYDESENIIRTSNSKGELSYKLGDYEVTYKREKSKDNVYMYHRIFANGNQVALHIKHLIDDRKQVDRTLYFHKDNLGSTLLTTDNMARVVNKDLYAPYGEKINLKKATSIYKGVLDNRLPGFTGHNTIEGANVIVMKSRVYDPVIARFTSADTIVPDVNSALGFNRYAYVYNNPLKYVDPDGHFPFMFFLGAAIFTVGATSDNAIVKTIGMTVGGLMMGKGISGAFGKDQLFLEGATRGFTQTVLSGGDISQIFTNTITGGLNAQITNAMPGMFGLEHDQFSLGLDIGHGVVQGLFTALRGGKFKTGFISGMASKGISAIMRDTSLNRADPFVKMSITAVLSGMASKASGGDFVQGAMSAMVVWLYNDYMDNIANKIAFGSKRDEPSWFSKLVNNISKTNKSRQHGNIGVLQGKNGTISVIDAKFESSRKNLLGGEIGGSFGKIKGQVLTIDGTHKSFTFVNAGFNTFSGRLNGRIGHLKLGATGYVGGLSGQLQLGKKGAIGGSIGFGFGFMWDWVDYE